MGLDVLQLQDIFFSDRRGKVTRVGLSYQPETLQTAAWPGDLHSPPKRHRQPSPAMRGQRAFFNRRLERTGKKVLTLLNYPCGLPLLSEDIVTTTYMPGRVQCQNPLGRFDEDIYISRLPMSRMTDVQRVQDRQRKVTYIPYPHKSTKSQGQRRRDGSSFAVREERRGIIRVLRGRLPVSM
jgi:hypothetical protein